MTTFVTGGLGFIGSNFAISHLQKYPTEEIVIIDNNSYAANGKNLDGYWDDWRIKHIFCDIADIASLSSMYNIHKPRMTYHFAAESHVDNSIAGDDEFVRSNIIGTHNILKCIRKYGGKLLHVSTDEVYGSLPLEGYEKFTEETAYNPRNPYSATKAASDHLVRAYINTHKIDAVVTNCSNNYGPRQHSEKFIPTVIRHIKDNKAIPVYGSGVNIRDWLYVEDHCEALLSVGESYSPGDRYNIGGGVELTNNQMVVAILDIMGKPVHDGWFNYVNDRPGHDLRYAMNSLKMRARYGWMPRHNLTMGLEKTLRWYNA